jgi:hypothetical protein
MLKKFISPRSLTLILFVLAAALSRVLFSMASCTPLVNFTPIGAMALFGGAYFSRGKAFLFPLLTLWISDLILCRVNFYHEWRLFYEGFAWVYAAFALMVLVGRYVETNKSVGRFISSIVLCTLIHWVLTDLGVWMSGTIFPVTFAGWVACMVAAIPYEFHFIMGTAIYGFAMFGGFEWLQSRVVSIRPVVN